ncbi:DegV family protein [Desemzia sp. RIT804]|uniref:DegV family protein n=1 Tax=Desemzia sp. RIT 804 TaxID=2810209 RepID=UPI00194F9F3C|nr:DegV family protein [Desemzia sp. RIT 804]MBM6614332.1 DegV family protein [Desemzia sp. RIT 804]
MTKLIIDSGCDQNETMQASYDYEVVPLSITIEGKSYLDGEEIELDTVYDYMRQGIVPKTSQISAESMIKTLDRSVAEKEDVIYLALSSALSGTYSLGFQIMETYKEKHPELKFTAVDSKGGAGGAAIIALKMLQMIEEGYGYEEIVDFAKWGADHVKYHFTLSNLEWLVKGGRLPKVASQVGTALNIRPYLKLEEGSITVQKLIRGEKRVFKRILKDVQNGVGEFTQQTIGISHADDEELAKTISEQIKEVLPDIKIELFQIGAVLGPHVGIGGVGVFYYNEKPQHYQSVE